MTVKGVDHVTVEGRSHDHGVDHVTVEVDHVTVEVDHVTMG